MQWRTNKNITEKEINKIKSYINEDLLIDRLCYELKINEVQLFQCITKEALLNLMSCLLINRNINTKNKINCLLNDLSNSITNPHDLINADEAATLISKYLKDKNSIIYIYGDYDCDGVVSIYILADVLMKLAKCEIKMIFPERENGYGINLKFCENVVKNKSNKNILVITVDNGITKKEEVKLLKDNNIEVIVTDHHHSKENETPDCLIVNPFNAEIKQDDTFKHLCGAGIAFKIAQLVQEKFNVYNMINYTPYLAIATLGDVMPLNNENMAIIQYGLEIINSKDCPKGIKELMDLCKIDILTSKDILWTIVPMINACGRLGNTALASKLFFKSNNIKENVKQVKAINEKRKDITKKAKADISEMNFDNDKVCIITTNKYPKGILGIIAGKATDIFKKPSLVASLSSDNYYHGSIRSIDNIDMIELLRDMKQKELIVDYGGHSGACVCTFKKEQISEMNKYFNENVISEQQELNTETKEEILNIDEIITTDYLNKIIFALVNLIPYNNKEYKNPTFSLIDLKVVGYKLSNNNPENIEFTLRQDSNKEIIKIWAWGFGSKYLNELKCPEKIHLAGEITKSFMNKNYTFNVVDIMKA